MSQRPTEKNLPVLMPTPTQALARQDAIRLSQEHLKAKIPNQHQATGELLSLQQLTSALETGRDRELGWSESFALAAVTQLLQQDQNTIAARATLDGADSVITTSIPKTEAAPVTNNLLEVSPEILNDPDFKKHLNDREVSLEPKTSHPWLKNSLSQLGLSGLRTVLSTLVRFLPDWIRKEIEDYTPISDDVTWSLAESALTPSRMRYVGRIEDAAPEFLERAAVLNSYVDVSGTGNKLELSTFLKRKGAWGLEQAIWYCKRVDQAPLAEHLARCIFPLDRGYRTLPLAVGLDIGSAQFLDKKGQPLQLEVKIAINLFGGFKVLNAPPAAKSLSYEVQIAGPDYPTDCRTQMLARLKTHLPISDVSTEENKTLLKKLNQLDIDPNNKAEIWHHRLTEQDYRYFASEELAKLYQRSQKNCFALLQGLRMGTCDAIAALEYHQLNQIDGIVALHADVLTIRFDNQFVESPGHVINRVYSSSGHQDLDFTKMMRRTEGKIPKLKRVDLPADLAENQATLVGQSLRRSLLGLENSLRPSLSSQSSKIQKAPELTAQIRLLAGSTISYGRYTQGFFELIKNRALVELIEPSLEQQKPNLVKILRQIHDLSSDCIEPTDIAQFFPKVGDDNKYPELRNKLKAVLISEAKRAVADHDEPVAMAILDWCACQMAPQVNPKSSGVKSVFNYNPNFKISAQDFAEILCLYKKYDDFKNMQLVTLASQYIKEFRALPDVEVTYQILEPIFFMAEKFDLLGNIDHMAALYAVACERLGKLDLDNPNNQRLAMLLETNLVVFNLIILNSGIERFVMKLIYACRELDSAAVGRGLRLYNQGRSLGMDQKIQEALGRILPSDAIAFCRVFNSVEEALCEIETAINLGLPEDLSEHKAEYQKLVHTVFSQVPKSPQVPGPAQKLVAHLSRIARGDQLIRELERRAAFGDYPIDLDRPDALEEMLCISELCKDLKLDFNLQNPTEVIINFSKLRACGCIDLSQLGLPHDLHDKSLWSLALIKYQLSDRTSSSSELESSSSQDTPFSVLFQDFIRTYRMQWQTCLLDLNNQDLTAKASVLKPHALYSNLRHPQLKQDTTIKSGYVQMLLRNSGISPQELYVAMLKFSAKSSSYKM